ncbi:MAG: hypothetical protein ACK559_27390, partial [bacterium]
ESHHQQNRINHCIFIEIKEILLEFISKDACNACQIVVRVKLVILSGEVLEVPGLLCIIRFSAP